MISQEPSFRTPTAGVKLPLNYNSIESMSEAIPGVANTATTVTAATNGFNAVLFSCTTAGAFSLTVGLNGTAAATPDDTNSDSTTGYKFAIPAYGSCLLMISSGSDYTTSIKFKTTTTTGTAYLTFLEI